MRSARAARESCWLRMIWLSMIVKFFSGRRDLMMLIEGTPERRERGSLDIRLDGFSLSIARRRRIAGGIALRLLRRRVFSLRRFVVS